MAQTAPLDATILSPARPLRLLPGMAAAIVLLLTACQSVEPVPYQAARAGADGGPGYSETRIDESVYRVSFEGNAATPARTVEDYLLYRAAEIAKQEGFASFTVLPNEGGSVEVETRPERTVCHYSPADFSQFVFYSDEDFAAGPEAPPNTTFHAYIDVKLGKPSADAVEPLVFKTDATLDYLEPCISGPAASQ
ncbi:CC0125/CC1285 family lipoprotein [Henriciella aquimarina]|uniref:CC0125/CC1285 family lipoprotein n=1 Tax=Henriciella aquimarina TaxID=545261 RepID=UPI0009FCD8B1|nr:hypothetical protein [Henriciella aquimarina]